MSFENTLGEKLVLALGRVYPHRISGNTALMKPAQQLVIVPRPRWKGAIDALLAVMSLAACLFAFWNKAPGEAALTLGACVFAAVLNNLDRLSKVKVGNTDIELAAQGARQATEQAYATIEHLRELAAPLAAISFETIAMVGRTDSIPDVRRLVLKDALAQALAVIGLPDARIREVALGFTEVMAGMHVVKVIQCVFHNIKPPYTPGMVPDFPSFEAFVAPYYNADFRMNPVELRKRLEDKGVVTPDVEEALRDYEYFMTEGKYRRPALWKRSF